MNLDLRKSMLLVGACTALGLGYSPNVQAASPNATTQAVQQAKKVTGQVSDSFGPVIGASVKEKGTTNATVTDADGKFTLNVKPGATLVITYVGLAPKEVVVGSQGNIDVRLSEDNNSLEEVVVIGYGVQKKKLVTGATLQVKGDDVARLNTTTPPAGLAGTDAGHDHRLGVGTARRGHEGEHPRIGHHRIVGAALHH